MKVIAIAALIAFSAGASAANSTQKSQASLQPIVVQQHSPLSVQFDRGTDQSPFVVSNKPSAEDKADAHELAVATDNLAKWTRGLAIASFFATLFAACSTILAWIATHDLRKLERAYVFVTVKCTGFGNSGNDGGRTINIKANFHNHGKTPAILKSFRLNGVYSDIPPTKLIDHANATRKLPDGLVIGRAKHWEQPHGEQLTQEQFTSLTDIIQRVYIVGVLKYEDVMGVKHEVGFCWMSQPQLNNDGIQFTICPSPLNYTT